MKKIKVKFKKYIPYIELYILKNRFYVNFTSLKKHNKKKKDEPTDHL